MLTVQLPDDAAHGLAMTTQDCANTLNAIAGCRLWLPRHIRAEVDCGRLLAEIDQPARGTRQRRFVRIAARDFCAWAVRYHVDIASDVAAAVRRHAA